ncbi:YitT family protein [Clostridium sp.]|uniref:YitT family protein n=1 Tax=Clostridium sp. TaxID=1506 RepID=UPI003463E3E0
MKRNKTLKEFSIMTLGMFLVAISAEFFLIPNNIVSGGITGLCIVVNNYIPIISVEALSIIINIVLFIVGFIFIGGEFGGKTIYAALGLSGMMWVMKNFLNPVAITSDLMLTAIFAPVLTGTGLALVFSQNASTGGTDIIAKIVNKYIKLDIGKCMLIIDAIVTIMGAITFGFEKAMYAIIIVFLNGTIIDKVINGFNICKQIMILSHSNDKIRDYIMNEINRGCTVVPGRGAYSGVETDILYSVLSRKQFIQLKAFIKDIDPSAFIIVVDAHEVLGQGFGSID